MQVSITDIKSIPQNITIRTSEYYTLKHKAEAYDKQKAKRSATMKQTNNKLTPAQRTESARKAAQARWNKKGDN
jgi:hypothetical protein